MMIRTNEIKKKQKKNFGYFSNLIKILDLENLILVEKSNDTKCSTLSSLLSVLIYQLLALNCPTF